MVRNVWRVVVLSVICGSVFAAADGIRALWVFHLRWMPATSFWRHGAVAVGVYGVLALAGLLLGRLTWVAARSLGLGREGVKRFALGPAPGFALVSVLWALAWADIALVQDVIKPRLWALAGVGLLCMVGAAVGAGAAALVAQDLCRRWPRAARGAGWTALGLVALTCAGSVAWELSPPAAAKLQPRNVLLITIDALRQDYLSCYGGPIPTPHIDRLAQEGVKFTHLWSASSWTRPSCASMHLGVYPTAHGAGEIGVGVKIGTSNVLPDDLPTLAETFAADGYATQAFVSNIQIDPRFGFSRGFDSYCMFEDIGRRANWLPLPAAAQPGRLVSLRARQLLHGRFISRPQRLDEYIRDQKGRLLAPSGAFAAGQAVRWLARTRQPFFLWVHLMDVHQYPNFGLDMRQPAGQSPDLMLLASTTAVEGPMDVAPWAWEEPDRKAEEEPQDGSDPQQRQSAAPNGVSPADFASRYGNNLKYADALVGCLLAQVDALGLRGATHVIFTSDHGEEFGEHGGVWHGRTQYEEVTRVPFIIRSPALADRSGAVVDAACSGIDVMPTALTLAGVPAPDTIRGRSLVSVAQGKLEVARTVCSEFTDTPKGERKALRWGMMKVISANSQHREELYDLVLDPKEQTNLAAELPMRLAELIHLMRTWETEQTLEAAKVRGGRKGRRVVVDKEMTKMLRSMGYVR